MAGGASGSHATAKREYFTRGHRQWERSITIIKLGSSPDQAYQVHYRPEIDGLRAIAVLSVIFFHAGLDAIPGGYLGVDIFFVISGFIICFVADDRRPAEFMWDRIARVVPLYWLLTLAATAVAFIDPSLFKSTIADPALVLQSLLFIPFVKANLTMQPVLFVGWTLNYEMFFYLVFALCAPLAAWVRVGLITLGFVGLALLNPLLEPQGGQARPVELRGRAGHPVRVGQGELDRQSVV